MLIKAKALKGYKLKGLDGEIGKVEEFYFDDKHWAIRYLIAETGGWLMEWQVLISPYSLVAINTEERTISINLTKKKIEESPLLESDKPVSQQYEESYNKYYGQPLYWGGSFMWGVSPYIQNDPQLNAVGNSLEKKESESHLVNKRSWDPNLRSTDTVRGYTIRGTDGDIGHVDDFVIDDSNWAIRYLIVATTDWWPGKKVLISPNWIDRIDWTDSIAYVNVVCDDIKKSPEYTEDFLLNRDYETGLHDYYNRRGYWADELVEAKDETQIRSLK